MLQEDIRIKLNEVVTALTKQESSKINLLCWSKLQNKLSLLLIVTTTEEFTAYCAIYVCLSSVSADCSVTSHFLI
jgi:hypothetical protein